MSKLKVGDEVYIDARNEVVFTDYGNAGIVKRIYKSHTNDTEISVAFQKGGMTLTTSYNEKYVRLVNDYSLLDWIETI